MNFTSKFSANTGDRALAASDAAGESTDTQVPVEYFDELRRVIAYLARFTQGAPDPASMGQQEATKYIVGYALPFLHASVPAKTVMLAARRWTERSEAFFPKNPGQLLVIAREIMNGPEADPSRRVYRPSKALDVPPPTREERNRQRVRLGLDPLPDKCDDQSTQ